MKPADANGRLSPAARLRHPEYFDTEAEPFDDVRDTYAPLVWQCRYGGIEVPDPLRRFSKERAR